MNPVMLPSGGYRAAQKKELKVLKLDDLGLDEKEVNEEGSLVELEKLYIPEWSPMRKLLKGNRRKKLKFWPANGERGATVMGDIFVLAEHRQGELRDITLEMLTKAQELAPKLGGKTVAVLLGSGVDSFAEKLTGYCDQVLYVDDPLFADYNSDKYQKAMAALLRSTSPNCLWSGIPPRVWTWPRPWLWS
jgi:hypothetical protein